MGATEIEEFLSHLAVKENVAQSIQNQALNAIIFLYREILKIDLKEPIKVPLALQGYQNRSLATHSAIVLQPIY